MVLDGIMDGCVPTAVPFLYFAGEKPNEVQERTCVPHWVFPGDLQVSDNSTWPMRSMEMMGLVSKTSKPRDKNKKSLVKSVYYSFKFSKVLGSKAVKQ